MEEKILREILAITKENNEMIHKLNFHRKFITYYSALKWLIILVIAYAAYQAATPYIDQAQATIDGIKNFSDQTKQIQSMDQKSLIDFLQNEVKKRIGQ